MSGGSACSSSSSLPSHVLVAIGVPKDYIHGSVRISLSHTTTDADVSERICPVLQEVLPSLLNEDVRTEDGTDRRNGPQ